jgi:uncharacterized protein (TIGR03435 family)
MTIRVSVGVVAALAVAAAQPLKPASPPKFAVASVKPCDPNAPRSTFGGSASAGRIAYTCQPLTSYIRESYALRPKGAMDRSGALVSIEGGPAWVNSDPYQITAKADGNPDIDMTLGPMLQALLEDRFQLKLHRATRDIPVYAMTVAKSGLKLPASKPGGCIPRGPGRRPLAAGESPASICGQQYKSDHSLEMRGVTIADFWVEASTRFNLFLDRRVIDRTGVPGLFDFDLPFVSPDAASLSREERQAENLRRLQGALSRVGLALKADKGPAEIIVIDQALRPSAN